MSVEHQPPLLERTHQKTDVLAELRSPSLKNRIGYFSDWLRQQGRIGAIDPAKLATIEKNLNIGVVNLLHKEVVVTGDMFELAADGSVIGETVSAKAESYIFAGFSLIPLVDRYVPVAKLYDPNSARVEDIMEIISPAHSDDPQSVLRQFVAIPELLRQMEMTSLTEDMNGLVAEFAGLSKEHLALKKFKDATIHQKAEQLHAIEDQINQELGGFRGTTISVETGYFIARYDGLDLPLAETITDYNTDYEIYDSEPVPRFVPHGKYVKAGYVELDEYGDGIADLLSTSHLTDGVPCIEVRDDLLQATYYIPMDEVQNILYGKVKREWWPAI